MTSLKKHRVLLIGSGGIGTITALNLEASGQCAVTAVLRSNYAVVKEKGFSIESIDHGRVEGWRPSEIRNCVPDVSGKAEEGYDWVVVCTKNVPDVPPTVAEVIRSAVTVGGEGGRGSVIVLVQNGVNIEKPLLKAFPKNVILSGVSLMGANEVELGVVVEDDPDRLIVGPWRNEGVDETVEDEAAREFVDLYNRAGKAKCTYEKDVGFVRWRKLIYNAVWNPVCALTGLDTGRLRLISQEADKDGVVETLIKPAMNEVRAVARSQGVELPAELVQVMVDADPLEIFCVPSMLQDVRKGRFVEVENILGEVVRCARDKGVNVAMVGVLYQLMRAKQWGTKERSGMVNAEEELKKRQV